MIQSYKLPILSEDAVYHIPVHERPLQVVNQWSYHARLYHAAQFVAEHPNVTLIQLSSFGCGLDALTTSEVRDILESHERIYTMIKLDEVSNLGTYPTAFADRGTRAAGEPCLSRGSCHRTSTFYRGLQENAYDSRAADGTDPL